MELLGPITFIGAAGHIALSQPEDDAVTPRETRSFHTRHLGMPKVLPHKTVKEPQVPKMMVVA